MKFIFIYLSGKLSNTINAFVSNIDCIFMDTFHYIDLKLWDKVKSIDNAKKGDEYKTIPKIGELFLFVDREGTFRGRRIQDPANSELIRIHLIDTGKELEIKFEAGPYFELPTYLNFPDLATMCKLKNSSNILKDLLFKRVVLRKITEVDFPGFIDEVELLHVEHEVKSAAIVLPSKLEPGGITRENLTRQELDVLFEEPLNTSDPMLSNQ